MLTKTLQHAVKRIAALTARDQNELARWMFKELADETRWDRALRRSHTNLGRLARAALADPKGGRTRELDPDRL